MNYLKLVFFIVVALAAVPAYAGEQRPSGDLLSNQIIVSVLDKEGKEMRSIGTLMFCGEPGSSLLKQLNAAIIQDLLMLGKLPNNRVQRINQVVVAAQAYVNGITNGLRVATTISKDKRAFCSDAVPVAKRILADEFSERNP